MLKLCLPFSKPRSDKLLKISPSYTKVVLETEQEAKEKCVHTQGIHIGPDKEIFWV